ncbi:MAG: hypothetical protein VX619_10630 [bacterium]|nr:hypothetical protein [bacterium]
MRFLFNCIFFFLIASGCLFCSQKELREKAKQGIVQQKQGRCAHAIKLFKEVVNSKPHWYSLYNRIASCFQKLDYDEIAMKYYRKTLTYDPVNSRATTELQNYLKSKKTSKSSQDTIIPKVSKEKFFSSNEIQKMQQRLWFLRDGKLMTSLRDGRDLREYSSMIYSEVFPERGSSDGFPVLMQEEYGAPQILFFLFPNGATMIRLTSDEYDCQLPLFNEETNELLFVARKVIVSPESVEIKTKYTYEDKYSVYGISLKEGAFEEKPRIYLENFHRITDLKKGPVNINYIVGQKTVESLSRVFEWTQGENINQISSGFGNHQSVQQSPDGKKLISMVRGPDDKLGYIVINLDSKESFALTSIRSSRMAGVWSPDSKNFIFSSSNSSIKDSWETKVYKVTIPQLLVSELFESNFLYKDFLMSESGEMLYFLSNYDNNYEAYRYNIETKSQDRLTISTGDETRLGFWTFSGI